MRARKSFLAGFAAALLTAVGCSSSEGDGGTTSPAIVCDNGDAVAPDALTMMCGGATDSTTERINVVMGGPASGSTTLRGINFDVTYARSKLEFVPAASYTSPLFSNTLLPAVGLLDGQEGRVLVSIQQAGSDPDVVVPAGQYNVLSLSFRRVAGATFGPTPLTFENAEYTRPQPLTPISFPIVNGPTLSYQP